MELGDELRQELETHSDTKWNSLGECEKALEGGWIVLLKITCGMRDQYKVNKTSWIQFKKSEFKFAVEEEVKRANLHKHKHTKIYTSMTFSQGLLQSLIHSRIRISTNTNPVSTKGFKSNLHLHLASHNLVKS